MCKYLDIYINCSHSPPAIAVKNASVLRSMAYMKRDRYSACKGEQLYCATRISNRMSTYNQE